MKGPVMSRTRLTLDQVRDLSMTALTANGADQENAAAVTHFVWSAERDSCHSHGLFRLPGYIAALKSGKVNGCARPKISDLAPAAIRVDGDNGYAPMALETGRDPLVARARETGIAAACPGGRRRASAPIPMRSGCRRSCCSRRR